ncbi:iron-containing alcohol dehydrogenase family protein [Sphingobium sp. H39-3-25]|uniref:iron-containing alcohol dehydrogenase family protein n=1 Tax=Sphingobium arseniciresistens TaxID=3030834 RepID=UPI0023B90657|nr:iron-containing alcohol dehydrogenase family protein [Sphingobium arseniciresistens]
MNTLSSYQHVTPPLRVFSGAQCLGTFERELKRLGVERAMIFCGRTLGRPGSPLDLVRATLGDRLAGVFSGVRAHSPVPDVEAAVQALRDAGADGVIAVGGGSAIVTARAASILLAEGRPAADLATSRTDDGKLFSPRLEASKIPQIIIPTTPTTAIVKAGSAIFDPVGKVRLAMFDPKTRAQSVFIHPDMIASAPDSLVLSASYNVLAMAIEGLMSLGGDPIADGQLMHALRLVAESFSAGTALDESTRGDLIIAAMLCGQGTDHSGAGAVTVLGHAVGVPHNVENGIVNAIVLPHVIAFNANAAPRGLAKIGAALGIFEGDAEALLGAVLVRLRALLKGLGAPARLRDVGVPTEALRDIAEHAMDDWFLRGNPRPVAGPSELEQLLGEAW